MKKIKFQLSITTTGSFSWGVPAAIYQLVTRRAAVDLPAHAMSILRWNSGTCAHVSSCFRSGWRSLSTSCSGKAVLRCVCAYASEGSQTLRSFYRTSDRWRTFHAVSCAAAASPSPLTAFHICYTYTALHDRDLLRMLSYSWCIVCEGAPFFAVSSTGLKRHWLFSSGERVLSLDTDRRGQGWW